MGAGCSIDKSNNSSRKTTYTTLERPPVEFDPNASFDIRTKDVRLPGAKIREYKIGEYFLEDSFVASKNSEIYRTKEKKYTDILAEGRNRTPAKPRPTAPILKTEAEQYLLHLHESKDAKLFKKMLREGPLMKHRWSCWKATVNPNKYYRKGVYETLITIYNTKIEKDITKDLHRTFPEFNYFSMKTQTSGASPINGNNGGGNISNIEEVMPAPVGQEQLSRLLKAIALYFPSIGYVQGMNFLVGFILMISGGNEIEAFWFYVALAQHPRFMFAGLYAREFPLVMLLIHVFHKIFAAKLPKLSAHFAEQMVPDLSWIFKWILSPYIYILPIKIVMRLWDYILTEDTTALLRIGFALIYKLKDQLMGKDIMEINPILKSLLKCDEPDAQIQLTADSIIKIARELDFTPELFNKYARDFHQNSTFDDPKVRTILQECMPFGGSTRSALETELIMGTLAIDDEGIKRLVATNEAPWVAAMDGMEMPDEGSIHEVKASIPRATV